MKTRFTWLGIVAAIVLGISIFFAGCQGDGLNDVTIYRGQVVYINTTIPFPDLTVKVTNGSDTHCQTQTDAGGNFSLKVRVNEIDGSYYLLAGDETCVPKKVALGGYGQAEVDLGVVEVEGPALPTVKTTPLTEVTAESATLGGEVMTDGRLAVTARGICYGTEQQPTVEGLHTTDGAGLGSFTTTLKNLDHNTIFYARAYATNKMGTAYGDQVKFTTELGVPIVISDSVYRITAHSAKCKGHVESDGGYAVTKKGTCWSRQPDPTVDDECTNDGSGKGEFTSSLNNLLENTTYYVRTYATNATATVYGEQIIITTLDGLPVVKTDSINNITATGFTAFGTVVSDCDIPVTARGFCYSTSQYPTIEDEHTTVGKGLGSFLGNIRNLNVGTIYYVRAYATNETGTVYGEQKQITTKDGLPTVETNTETTATALTISAGGKVTDNGGFTIIERGICYSPTNSEPTVSDAFVASGKGNGSFNTSLQKLTPATKYYLRAYATNENGTAYGEVVTVVTKDGNASVELSEITNITALTASAAVTVTDAGSATLQSCGVCWSTNPNPTIWNSKTVAGGKVLNTSYECEILDLQPNTTYYVRGYATTNVTTAYSEQKSFSTNSGLPTITTSSTTATSTSITSGGEITDDGGYNIIARGVCYSTNNSTPTIEDSYTTAGIGIGAYSTIITNVSVSTTYYIRAYATNSIGTAYGDVKIVTTGNGLPSVTTTIVGENVTQNTAVSGGQVTNDGGYPVTARGVCWNTLPYPTINDSKTTDGIGVGYFSSTITGIDLTSSNIYYVRAYATNENGTTYGEQVKVSNENWDYKNLPSVEYGGYIYRIYPDIGAMTWEAAKEACENLVYGGYNDWFLPTKDELIFIMTNYKKGWYNIEGTIFNFIPRSSSVKPASAIKQGARYWTSTSTSTYHYYVYYTVDSYYAQGMGTKYYDWYYHPETPVYSYQSDDNSFRVRPVRKYLANQ